MAKKNKNEPGGLVFVGFLMIGLAAGLFTNNTAVGVLAGLGFGFIGMAIVNMLRK